MKGFQYFLIICSILFFWAMIQAGDTSNEIFQEVSSLPVFQALYK